MTCNAPTILFAEDCDSDFELACVAVEQVRPTVSARRVSNGRDFLNYVSVSAEPVALFILDLSLPDTSGLMLTEELRRSPLSAATPIVIFSSSSSPRDREAARKVGADDYQVKPVEPGEFLRVIEQIVVRWLPEE